MTQHTGGSPRRRRAWGFAVIGAAVIGGVVLLALPDGPARACTMIGSSSALTVALPTDVVDGVETLDVELCQDGECRSSRRQPVIVDAAHDWDLTVLAESGSLPADVDPEKLTTLVGDYNNLVHLPLHPRADLGDAWTAAPGTTVTVVGTAADGSQVFKHSEVFALMQDYPNGPDCDAGTNWLQHTVEVPNPAVRPA
ncbi:hypothetical protein [Nocardioides yefusunii]|uniref:DUF4232 domain-containing protein n=1 Tax=Nocardioides yefusunii TaxID=2500546 RepID=A0ABW1R113_9ACTN|nr:hypothetical protein [Nocardioides yefusunii]